MKIAIIEDRVGRLEQYVEFEIRSFKEVIIITGFDFDALILSLKINASYLNQFDCVASHRSALSNEDRDTIKEHCKLKKKPLIFFSGGITSSVFKDVDFPFLHINSKNFYSLNLKLFLEDCLLNGAINLLILQFGIHWKLSLLLNMRNSIAVAQNKLEIKNEFPTMLLDDSELIKRTRDLQINLLVKSDLVNERTKNILLGSDVAAISTESIQEIKSVLNYLINDTV